MGAGIVGSASGIAARTLLHEGGRGVGWARERGADSKGGGGGGGGGGRGEVINLKIGLVSWQQLGTRLGYVSAKLILTYVCASVEP